MPGVAPHDLHNRAALVRLHRVTQAVDRLHGGVGGGIVADGVVGADDVVVDRRRNAHHAHALLAQLHKTAERAVAADGDDAVQPQQLTGGGSLLLTLQRAELLAARGVEHRAAAVDDVRDALGVQLNEVAGDQTVVAAANADALDPAEGGGTHHRADRRIHTRRVAARGQHADPFDFRILSHKTSSFLFFEYCSTRAANCKAQICEFFKNFAAGE